MKKSLNEYSLQERFQAIKDILPKTKLSRWSDVRHLFQYKEQINRPAEEARAALFHLGFKTKEMWKEEFRFQRKIYNLSEILSFKQCEEDLDYDLNDCYDKYEYFYFKN